MQVKGLRCLAFAGSMLSLAWGCAGGPSTSDTLLLERNDGTPVERISSAGDVQSYPADSLEALELMSVEEPAADGEIGTLSQPLKAIEVQVRGPLGLHPGAVGDLSADGRSCSAGNGGQDCYCTGGCCRNETSCWCC